VSVEERAARFAALGDPHRLAIVDALVPGDLTVQEAAAVAAAPMNLVSHHLAVLEVAGLIERRVSEGDRRRRYLVLQRDAMAGLLPVAGAAPPTGAVVFVCTHNSARSQFAEGLWRLRTGGAATSAGSRPSRRVHPQAVRAALRRGVDLSSAVPRGYAAVALEPSLVVSVCDRAREGAIPFDAPQVHWSVPDPVEAGSAAAFSRAFDEISERVEWLAAAR
jgi:ArsR family transcriptional regulator, arsenate/arsenite/antimonite-responsive transcriptional repressor / arsenate reductase (thioredoxin)